MAVQKTASVSSIYLLAIIPRIWNKLVGVLATSLLLYFELSFNKRLHFFSRLYLIEIESAIEGLPVAATLERSISAWLNRLWYMSKKFLSCGSIDKNEGAQVELASKKGSFLDRFRFIGGYGGRDMAATLLAVEY